MDTLTTFLKQYPIKRYDKGQLILCQDMTPNNCYVIRSGFVKTYLITADGSEKPVNFDAMNDLFPLAWSFGKADVADYYHQAYTDCEIYHVPRDDLAQIVQKQPRLLNRFMHYFLDKCRDYQAHVNSLEQAKAADKILFGLDFLNTRFGKKITRSRTRMQLPLTQQDLANFLGLTRETTGTQLKQLERQGIITYNRQEYVIHTDKLSAVLADRS